MEMYTVPAQTMMELFGRKGFKIEDQVSGCQVPLRKKPVSKLYHYAEKFQHPGAYHLRWQHAVRNNSWRRNFDCFAWKNCSDKNGLGHAACHCG